MPLSSGDGILMPSWPILLPPILFHRNAPVIVAAVLHDVIDDTEVPLSDIQAAFGEQVAGMVSSVSRLSQMNQLLRRSKREV